MGYKIEYTDEFEAWWDSLTLSEHIEDLKKEGKIK
jgi:hypothetical protein